MARPPRDKLTPPRAEVLRALADNTLRVCDVKLVIRRALVEYGWAKVGFAPGEGWYLAITPLGRAVLEAREAQLRTK